MKSASDKKAEQAYFKEARSWETSKVTQSELSRRRAWMVASGATVVALAMSATTALLATRESDPPVVIRVNDTTGAVDVVSRLKAGDTTYEEVTRKYWTELYVRSREGYSRELAEDFYATVGLMSGPVEQRRYAEYFSPKNPISPLNVFGDAAKVRIVVKSSSFIKPTVLLVRYTRLVDRPGTDRPEVSNWAATVVFKFSGAPMSEKDRRVNPLGYQVLEYRIDPDASSPAPAPVVLTAPAAPAPVGPAITVMPGNGTPPATLVQVPAIAPAPSE